MELADAYLDRGDELVSHRHLTTTENAQHIIFQSPEAEVGFCQEVPAPCGRIQQIERGQLSLELL